MINSEEILSNASKLNMKGLDRAVLNEAEEVFEKAKWDLGVDFGIDPENDAEGMIFSYPEEIAYWISLTNGNLSGKKFLDLGCGARSYLPVLSYAMRNLGADVYAVDIKGGGRNYLDTNGKIRFKSMDLTNINIFSAYNEFFQGNDLINASSLLDFGLLCENSDGIIKHLAKEDKDLDFEFANYNTIIDKVKRLNGQKAIYRLESPSFYKQNKKNLMEKLFGTVLYEDVNKNGNPDKKHYFILGE